MSQSSYFPPELAEFHRPFPRIHGRTDGKLYDYYPDWLGRQGREYVEERLPQTPFQMLLFLSRACTDARLWVGDMTIQQAWDTSIAEEVSRAWRTFLLEDIFGYMRDRDNPDRSEYAGNIAVDWPFERVHPILLQLADAKVKDSTDKKSSYYNDNSADIWLVDLVNQYLQVWKEVLRYLSDWVPDPLPLDSSELTPTEGSKDYGETDGPHPHDTE